MTVPRCARPDAVTLLIAGVGVAALAAWSTGPGGGAGYGSTAEVLTSLGRLSGLLSAGLLLVQVVLMTGVPWLTGAVRADVLQGRHRVVGTTSVGLLGVHVALIVPGHATTTHQGLWLQARHMVRDYPGVLPAVIGSVVLLIVAGSSARRARRRLGYRPWRLLHLYAYAGIGLAMPHQLWNGADLTTSGAVRIGWWSAYLAVVAAVLTYRVIPALRGAVARGAWPIPCRVAAAWFGGLVVVLGLMRYPTSTESVAVSDAPMDHSGMEHTEDEAMTDALAVPPPSADQRVVEGPRIETEYGPVQVQIRVTEGRVVAAYAIAYPDEQLADRAVSSFSLPELAAEAVAAQNAHIDTISGATTTSDAYRHSLQAAIDAAHLV